MVKELLIRLPNGSTQSTPLDIDYIGIGRSTDNELAFPDDSGLSRKHMAFERRGAAWIVSDLGSKNGTMVNGDRIAEAHTLQPGDRVSAGHIVIEYGASAPSARIDQTVVFVERGSEEVGTTVVAKLEGALSSKGPQSPQQDTRHMQALIKAGRELSGHRPLQDLFAVILDLAIEAVGAARGVLMTLESNGLIMRAARGDKFKISSVIRDRVLDGRESMLVRDATLDRALRERLSIVEQGVRSMMAVPLQTDNKVIGLIYVDSPYQVLEFSSGDLNLLTVLSNVAAIRIEHARHAEVEHAAQLIMRDLQQAAEIQRGLLPSKPPKVQQFDLAGYNEPCRTVGGDYFDYFMTPDGKLALLVADVAGKGMPAAMMMSSLQARVHVLAEAIPDLGPMVTRLNKIVKDTCPANRFITFFMSLIDPATGEVTYCNAGHNPAIVARADGKIEMLGGGGGPPLGILPFSKYSEETTVLHPGDVFVLYSDGMTEAAKPELDDEFGEERLAGLVSSNRENSADTILDIAYQSVKTWLDGNPAADDVTLVVAKRLS